MSGEVCFIVPTCKRADGKDVESKLFADLWKLSGNYEWTEKQYKIATNEAFLEAASANAVFDNNGQITAKSFMDITGITFTSDEVINRLTKQWGDNHLPTEEVSSKVAEFNSKEELKDDYVPSVIDEGEVVRFTIARRNDARVEELQKFIENHELLKVVAQRLKDLGVAYDFVGKKDRYGGRFSTENAEKAFDGLYHLIEIADGGDIEETLLEESAHLATLACKDSVFINRLLDALNENNVNKLFTEAELSGVDLSSRDAKLELAGKLVAKAMKNEATEFKGLLGNIKRVVYNIFSKGNLSSLLSAKARAKIMAERLAHGFLYETEEMDINEALKYNTTLYSAKPITVEAEKLKQTLASIRKLSSRIGTFSGNLYDNVYRKLSEKAVLGEDDYSTIDSEEAVAHMCAAAEVLLERFATITGGLSNLTEKKFINGVNIDDINAVYEADSVYDTLSGIINTYEELKKNGDVVDTGAEKKIDSILAKIKKTLNDGADNLANFKELYATQLMREFCGADNIELAADVYTDGLFTKSWRLLSPAQKRGVRRYSMQNLVNYYNDELSDTNPVLTFFRTYSNHKDITTQVFYNIVRQAKAKEGINYNDEITTLINLENKWKAFLNKHKDFSNLSLYERLDDGSLTGYFISEVNRGQFNRDKQDMINTVKKQFLEDLKEGKVESSGGEKLDLNKYKRLTRAQKYTLFNEYLTDSDAYDKFMNEAYIAKGIYSDKYINKDFIKLREDNPEFKELYDEIVKFKKTIDSEYLTDISEAGGGKNHGVDLRLPQFEANWITRIFKNNRLITKRDLYDSRHMKDLCMDVTSDNFGSQITEDVAFKGESDDNPPDLRKLALYGINLLNNPNNISTDIFRLLELYTEMACRFHTSQSVASRLELFHSQLKNRKVGLSILNKFRGENKAEHAKSISTNKRENILRNFVYAKPNPGFWKKIILKAGGILTAFGAIRALSWSYIAGVKNYLAGFRVLSQDVKAGVLEGVTMKDVVKSTLLNLAPKHLVGEVGRIILGRTVAFDHYQKLIDRWDSYRTPSRIHKRKGFNPLQTMVNIAMANYSTTDNALIGTIYYSKLNNVLLYDTNEGKYIPASDAYNWKNDNPEIKPGLLNDIKDKDKYEVLKAARDSVKKIRENNSNVKIGDNAVVLSLFDSKELGQLEDFYNTTGETPLPIRKSNGTYKTGEEVEEILTKAMQDLCFSNDKEFELCSGINDYIISSQGVYGMLNATEFQSDVYTQSLGKIKGYMFGILQRNFLTNYRISNKKVNHSVLDSLRLAVWSVFSGAKELAALGDITPAQYRLYAATLCFLPPALGSKRLVKHLERCGWDPDQLEKVISAALGFWINLGLSILARMLYRGNEKAIGTNVHKKKGKMHLDKAALNGTISMFTSQRYRKLIEPGILFPESGKSVDKKTALEQIERWEKSRFAKNQRDPSEGYFRPGTKEFKDRKKSFYLKNIVYNTQDPMYYFTGMAYRLTRGIRDEGMTLMNPMRFANDCLEMGNFGSSIMVSSGYTTLLGGIFALCKGQDLREAFLDREINFYLNKMGFTYDSTPEDGLSKVQLLDWYGKQEKIDRYQAQDSVLPQLWY